MISALAYLAAVAQRAPAVPAEEEKPAILIYWQPGFTPYETKSKLHFAAFSSGRIVWQSPAGEWKRDGNRWRYVEGKYFEGRAEPAAVARAVRAIEASGAFGIQHWNLYPPDSSSYRVVVRSGAKKLELATWKGEPPAPPPYKWDPKFYERGRAAWKLVHRLASELAPAHGKAIASPPVRLWI